MPRAFRLTRQAWVQIALRSLRHVVLAVLVSVAITYVVLETFSNGLSTVGLLAAIAAPVALAGPMVFYMTLKHYQLERAYERLEAAAARDSLTQCLNHGAFVAEVTAHLEAPASEGGALLVIDADHFKSINDRFGHACGDTALRMIAATIRGAAGDTDIVGRLGGEEFGVYMPGADKRAASGLAQELCRAIRAIALDVGGETCRLSVSIGGAVRSGPGGFGDLFRHADERLYNVKNAGRNNVEITTLSPSPANPVPEHKATLVYRGQKIAGS